ncbi:MAG: MBL fold metallo-hydrolase [Planctomycetota bacterium]
MDWRVISIGTMSANGLWGEREPARTGHATTTLVRTTTEDGEPMTILVDPGLPEAALLARLRERANLGPEDITHVFLTSFHPDCRRGIGAFERAVWWVSATEREAVGVPLVQSLKRLTESFEEPDEQTLDVLRTDIAVLQRCEPAPDRLGTAVDLFPLHGVTPGLTGLLLAAKQTVLLCGDAIATQDHHERGEVDRAAANTSAAKEAFAEAIEVADILVLGRDNAVWNQTRF